VNIYKVMTRDARFVAGAGACELELARQLKLYGASVMGQDQYAINKFAESLETVPRTLAENAGLNATDVVSQLYGYHSRNEPDNIAYGIDIESGKIRSAKEMGVYDSLAAKRQALRLASNAAITILRIDQIIMAKPAEGPKPPKQSGSLDTGED
jgi:T-complex protein 1 subunit theta